MFMPLRGKAIKLCCFPHARRHYCTAALAISLASVSLAEAELIADVLQLDIAAVNIEDEPINAIENQLRAQYEPIVKVELSFVNRVCKLSDEQRRNLIAKSNEKLTEYIKQAAKNGNRQQFQGVWIGNAQPNTPDPRSEIQTRIAELVKANLPEEQVAIYEAECRHRVDFANQAAVDNLVSRIDKELVLSPDQQAKIRKSLIDNFDKKWAPQPEMFMHGINMWPSVPDQWVKPHLTTNQQAAWARIPRNAGHTFSHGVDAQAQVIDDIDLDEGMANNKDQAAANE